MLKLIFWCRIVAFCLFFTLHEVSSATTLDSTLHQAAVEDSDGRAQMDSTLHQAAVLLFEQGDVNLPARVSPEALLTEL